MSHDCNMWLIFCSFLLSSELFINFFCLSTSMKLGTDQLKKKSARHKECQKRMYNSYTSSNLPLRFKKTLVKTLPLFIICRCHLDTVFFIVKKKNSSGDFSKNMTFLRPKLSWPLNLRCKQPSRWKPIMIFTWLERAGAPPASLSRRK